MRIVAAPTIAATEFREGDERVAERDAVADPQEEPELEDGEVADRNVS